MKTLGLLITAAIALSLSACTIQGQCDHRGDHGDRCGPGNIDSQLCVYDWDCAPGYQCTGGSCQALPVPPPRDLGASGGSSGSAVDGGENRGTGGHAITNGTGGAGVTTGTGGAGVTTGTGGASAPAGTGGAGVTTGTGGAGAPAGTGGAGSGPTSPDGGATCSDGGSCQTHPAPVCQFDNQCGLGGQCQDGECQRPCTADSACGTGQVCSGGHCATPTTSGGQCVFNADCGGGKTCINGYCHADCQANTDCPAADLCLANICQPDTGPQPECLSNGDCIGVHVTEDVCVDAVCRSVCVTNTDCCTGSSGSICQMGYCVTSNEVAPQCRLTSDCGAGQSCINAACD